MLFPCLRRLNSASPTLNGVCTSLSFSLVPTSQQSKSVSLFSADPLNAIAAASKTPFLVRRISLTDIAMVSTSRNVSSLAAACKLQSIGTTLSNETRVDGTRAACRFVPSFEALSNGRSYATEAGAPMKVCSPVDTSVCPKYFCDPVLRRFFPFESFARPPFFLGCHQAPRLFCMSALSHSACIFRRTIQLALVCVAE